MKTGTFSWPLFCRPQIKTAGHFPMKPEWRHIRYRLPSVALHLHDYHCRMGMGRQSYEVRPGDLTLTPARVVTQFELPVAGFHWCIHFFPAGAAAGRPVRLGTCHRLGAVAAYATERLQRVIESHRLSQRGRNSEVDEALASTALQELLLWLAARENREWLELSPSRQSALEHLRNTLDQHIREPICLAALARQADLGQSHLSRLFRKRFGMTIGRYVLLRRIELARQLLTTTRLPIKAVAAEVGIADAQYFNKQFRRVAGTSPTVARLMAQAAQPAPSGTYAIADAV